MPSMVRERGVVRGRWGRVPASPGARRRPVSCAWPRRRARRGIEPSGLHRRERRPAEQEALSKVDAERRDHGEVRPRARCPRPGGARRCAARTTRTPRRGPAWRRRGRCRATMSRSILMIVGPQRGDEGEARIPRAGVVDREPETGPPKRLHTRWSGATSATACCSVHSTVIWRGREPGLDDHAPPARASKRGSSRLTGVRLIAIPERARCRASGPRLRGADPARGSVAMMNDIELDARPVSIAACTTADRLREHRHLRAEQAFVLVQLARCQLDDRLERDAVQGPQAEEVVERLGLHDLRGLGHPDPVGEAGQLHRGGQGDQVAVGLGERVVDRDEAVLGPFRCRARSRRRGSRSAGPRGR